MSRHPTPQLHERLDALFVCPLIHDIAHDLGPLGRKPRRQSSARPNEVSIHPARPGISPRHVSRTRNTNIVDTDWHHDTNLAGTEVRRPADSGTQGHTGLRGDSGDTNAITEVRDALEVWARSPITGSTLERLGGLAQRFASRLTATGVMSLRDATLADCENFVWAPTRRQQPPSMHTVHLRRTALRGLYATLAQIEPVADPSVGVELPARTGRRARPLTDDEINLVRTTALGQARRPLRAAAIVALAETTATSGEIPRIRWDNVDFGHGRVELPGADPVRAKLIQVLDNLVTNAIKFTHFQGTVTIGTAVASGGGSTVELTVTDDGIGIPESAVEALFDPFSISRTGTGGESGTGLGLAIVKRIVEGHGGTINVDSEVDRGTTVTVRLPR